jgi:hypothetical protein
MKRLLLILLLCANASGAMKYHPASVKDVATGRAKYPAVRVRGIVASVRMEGTERSAFWIKLCESRKQKYCMDVRFDLMSRTPVPTAGDYVEVKAISNKENSNGNIPRR